MMLNLSERTLPPIEVEIAGVVYQVKPINRKVWREMTKIQKRVQDGEADAIFDQIPFILDLPEDVMDGLDFRQVLLIIKHVTSSLYAPFAGVVGEEKKV